MPKRKRPLLKKTIARRHLQKLARLGYKRLSVTLEPAAVRATERAKAQGLKASEAINEALIATFKETKP